MTLSSVKEHFKTKILVNHPIDYKIHVPEKNYVNPSQYFQAVEIVKSYIL